MADAACDASTNDELTWQDLTVAQLKEELSLRGLDTAGKKADLIVRLEQYDKGYYLAVYDDVFVLSTVTIPAQGAWLKSCNSANRHYCTVQLLEFHISC
jgi:hypothetical protein